MFTSKQPPRVDRIPPRACALARVVVRSVPPLILSLLLILLSAPYAHAAQADDAPPTPGEIFQRISPSIPYLETPTGTGSGILVKQSGKQYVVTNSHVVWPYQEAFVYFPDGTELYDVPLVDWDLLADIAVLGPVDVDVEPVNLLPRAAVEVGDVAYLIGYPYESDLYPEPTMAQGIISRLRQWTLTGLSYVQTDAATAPGQSGGILVAADGKILGLSTYILDDQGAFTLALSSGDLRRRMFQILRGYDVDQLGDRRSLLDDTDDRKTILLDGWRYGYLDYSGDVDMFVVTLAEGQQVWAWLDSYAIDPEIAIGPIHAHEEELVSGGPYVNDVYYEAPEDGEYLIMVRDVEADDTGAYLIGVSTVDDE